jgi:hypothetical protein
MTSFPKTPMLSQLRRGLVRTLPFPATRWVTSGIVLSVATSWPLATTPPVASRDTKAPRRTAPRLCRLGADSSEPTLGGACPSPARTVHRRAQLRPLGIPLRAVPSVPTGRRRNAGTTPPRRCPSLRSLVVPFPPDSYGDHDRHHPEAYWQPHDDHGRDSGTEKPSTMASSPRSPRTVALDQSPGLSSHDTKTVDLLYVGS